MSKKYTLSVSIITKNEADRITRCLESVKELADEIRQKMFVFADLVTLDDRSIRALLKEVSNDELILALKTSSA